MAILTPELRVPETRPTARAAGILGLGAHLPGGILTNADIEARGVPTSDQWIMERTGIRQRHIVGSGETASTIGAEAGRQALAAAGNPRIDAIIAATCSPDTLFPSTACLIQRALDLPGIPAFDVDAACSGFIYGVTVAEGLIATGTAERVLVIGTEAMTSLVDFGDRTTCVLFGDGAGAAVIGAVPEGGIVARRIGADGGDAELIYYGAPIHGDGTEPDRLRMAGKGTYRLAVDKLCGLAEQVCEDAGWAITDVDLFVPHQANLRIIEAAAKRVGVPMEKVMVNVEETGNTSAATIPIALRDAMAQGRLKPGDKVVLVAFGAGATWGGIALEWS
jgi:3-oxoacyl-[acyl-carrier-protein] synthase-3